MISTIIILISLVLTSFVKVSTYLDAIRAANGDIAILATTTKELSASQTVLAMTSAKCTKQQIAETLVKKGYTTEVINETMANNANTASKYGNVTATNLLATAQARLNAFILANPYLAVTLAATAAIAAIITINKKYKQSIEESITKSKELVTTFKDSQNTLKSNADTISTLKDEYKDLATGVDTFGNNISLTEEEFKRYHEITTQIASMFPTMVSGYDEQGNAILKNKGNVEALNEALKEQQRIANQEVLNNADDIFKGVKNETKQVKEDIDDINTAIKLMTGANVPVTTGAKKVLKDSNVSKSTVKNASGYGVTESYALRENATLAEQQQYQDKINALVAKRTTLLAKQEDVQGRVNSVTQAYLDNSTTYADLNNEQQGAISALSSALDPSKFEYDDGVMQDWIFSNLIVPIKENKDNVQSAISDLLSLDSANMSAEDYKAQVDEYVNAISSILNVSSDDVKISLGIDVSYNQVSTMLNDLKQRVSSDVYSMLADLPIEDLKFAYEINNIGSMTWDDILGKIKELKDKSKVEIKVDTSLQGVLTNIASVSTGLDKLNGIWKDVEDKKSFDFSSLVSKDFVDEFGNLGSAYEDFISTVSKTPDNLDATKSAFDRLVGAYLNSKNALNGVTEETKAQAIAALESQGITNAEVIVQEYLEAQLDETGKSMLEYRLAKETANGSVLDSTSDIENLISLVEALGGASYALQRFAQLKANVAKGEEMMANAGSSEERYNAGAYMKKINEGYMTDITGSALSEVKKALNGTTVTMPTYGGNAANNDNKKETSSKDKTDEELSKIIDSIQKKSEEIDSKISLLKEQLSFEELVGNTENINKINEQINSLLKSKPETLSQSQKELELLKKKYTSEENIATIEEAIESNQSEYMSARTEGLQSDIDLVNAKYEAEEEGYEQTRKYIDFIRNQSPEVSIQALNFNTDEISVIDKQLAEKEFTIQAYLKLGLTENSDTVKEIRDSIVDLEQEKYDIKLDNIELSFNLEKAVLDDVDTLKNQIQTAINLAMANDNTDLQLDLQKKIEVLNGESIKNIGEHVKLLQQQRSAEGVTAEEYIEYTTEINDLLSQQSSLISDQISLIEGQAAIFAEKEVYGKNGQDEWETKNEAEIQAIQDQIDALDKLNDKKKEETEIEDKLLEIQKLEAKLQELQANKTVKILKKNEDGSWQWDYIADYEEVAETEEEISDKRLELQEIYDEQSLAQQKAALEAEIELLEQAKVDKQSEYDEQYKDYVKSHVDILNEDASFNNELNESIETGFATISATIDTKMSDMNTTYNDGMYNIYTTVRNYMEMIRAELDSVDGVDIDATATSSTISGLPSLSATTGFATGGLNTSTGWQLLHGTQSSPERVLSSAQTEAFESLVYKAMPEIAKSAEILSNLTNTNSTQSGDSIGINIAKIELPNVKNGEQFAQELTNIAKGLTQKAKLKSAKG